MDADDFALDQDFAEAVTHGGVTGIFRAKLDVVVMQKKAFDRGLFAVDQHHNDFAVFGVLPRFTDCQIAAEDAGVLHRIPFDAQGEEIWTAVNGAVQHNTAVPLRLGVHG